MDELCFQQRINKIKRLNCVLINSNRFRYLVIFNFEFGSKRYFINTHIKQLKRNFRMNIVNLFIYTIIVFKYLKFKINYSNSFSYALINEHIL